MARRNFPLKSEAELLLWAESLQEEIARGTFTEVASEGLTSRKSHAASPERRLEMVLEDLYAIDPDNSQYHPDNWRRCTVVKGVFS